MCDEFLEEQRLFIKKQLKKFKYNKYSLKDIKENILLLDYFVSIKILLIDLIEI